MGGLKSMEKWQHAGLAQRDKVHFTRAGYLLVGDLFYDAFSKMMASQTGKPHIVKEPATEKPVAQPASQPAPESKPQPATAKSKPSRPRHATIQPPAATDRNNPPDNNDDRFPYISQ